MELEIKHLAPYLPYNLQMAFRDSKTGEYIPSGIMESIIYLSDKTYPTQVVLEKTGCEYIWMFKPMLRHMDSIVKNGKDKDGKVWLWRIYDECIKPYPTFDENFANPHELLQAIEELETEELPYTVVSKLFEWHFDVFNLIENNLAIEINE